MECNENTIKLSVIIPVYNAEKYLQESLDTVIKQSLEPIEIICVNDGSVDKTECILETYCEKYPFFQMISYKENQGQAYARNIGLENAKGKYIYFMDADDLLKEEHALSKIYEKAEESTLDGLFFNAEFAYETEELKHKNTDKVQMPEIFEEGIYSGAVFLEKLISHSQLWMVVWRQLWRKKFLVENNICFEKNTSPHEDNLFSFKAFLMADKVGYYKNSLYVYRLWQGSSTGGQMTARRLIAYCRCYVESLNFIKTYTLHGQVQGALLRYFKYIKQMVSSAVIELFKRGIDVWNLEYGEGLEKLHIQLLLTEKYPYLNRFFSFEEYELLKSCHHIIVYGAGKVGKDVIRLLDDLDIHDFLISVTNKDSLQGVYAIENLKSIAKDCVVIVSVGTLYQNEVIENLKTSGFQRYICLNDVV